MPLRMQLTQTGCGAACLAMLLSALGRRTSVAEARAHLPDNADGASMRDLIQAGAMFGLRLRPFRVPALTGLPTPFIAHWEGDHYVVVERIRRGWVDVADPARGRRRVPDFGTAVLLAEVPETLTPARRGRAPWLPLVTRALRDRRLLTSVVLASIAVQGLGSVVPLATKLVVDGTATGGALAVVATLAVVAHILLTQVRALLLIRLRTSVAGNMMRALVTHSFALPYLFFQRRTSGDLLSRLGAVAVLRDLVADRSLAFGLDLLTGLGYLAVLAVAAPWLALMTALVAAAQAAVTMMVGRVGLRRTFEALHASSLTQTTLVESISGIEGVKASGEEDAAVQRWSHRYERELTAAAGRDRALAGAQAVTEGLQVALALGVLVIIAFRSTSAELGTMLALGALATSTITPLAGLLGTVQQLHMAYGHLDRIADVLGTPVEPTGGLRPAITGATELRGVTAGYDRRHPILRDVSLWVPAGARVAVVGRSGSGKTTLGRVLLGLLEPAEGGITFDGVPLERIDRSWLRRHLGVVTQQTHLFAGSVADNIRGGSDESRGGDVEWAARMAEIHDEIAAMPLGYATNIGEAGRRLSGGQRQRIALARALHRRPRLLLLDEPTASLDAVTEERIRKNIAGLDCTQIVIAHRLSTIRDADLIVVLDRGRVVEAGTHDALVARAGAYADLIAHQATFVRSD
ncbi:peptidase domain-containing ABC transporter [Nonomuraea jabiensis]|uniref:ABC-type bacteriocin/lantibiotic exporter with double-glycine peptidase domain n=1 Tax=Nonomuraea jabiensis TaxID=882448 RepID=A0A7W9LF62_9ACTN|nr:peptidase domain-containing ABC transporter [Nonomuraea jabiensis]MBB5781586.1 ABC-type bacteriocin/lantibiotic exporter with double-glycine peptidase domain [Nonomuraea jabiensis]